MHIGVFSLGVEEEDRQTDDCENGEQDAQVASQFKVERNSYSNFIIKRISALSVCFTQAPNGSTNTKLFKLAINFLSYHEFVFFVDHGGHVELATLSQLVGHGSGLL